MASPIPGGPGSSQGRPFSTGSNFRPAQGPMGHPGFQSTESGRYLPSFQIQHGAEMNNPRNRPPSFNYHYPNGLPESYKMVPSTDQETPRRYVEDHLPTTFYLRPAKEVKAIFSTNNGTIPPRHLSHALPARNLHIWSAEEIQIKANAIRKKYWRLMKEMQKPTVWDDLYDYFDCYDIYFQGALNLWNLVGHIWHENQQLMHNLHNALAFEVGVWCDDWIAKDENRKKLGVFTNWQGNILEIFDDEDRKEVRDMDRFNMDILRRSLRHRQAQIFGEPWARPNTYPANTLGAHWEKDTVQEWLAGQPIVDTPSGLAPAPTSSPHVIGGSGSRMLHPSSAGGSGEASVTTNIDTQAPIAPAVPLEPIVVSGTNNQNAPESNHPGSATIEYLASSTTRKDLSTPVITPKDPSSQASSNGSRAVLPPCDPSKERPLPRSEPMSRPSAGPHGDLYSTPFMTGPDGATQPYLGHVDPPLVPKSQPRVPHPMANTSPQRPADDAYQGSGQDAPGHNFAPPMGCSRAQSSTYQELVSGFSSSHRYTTIGRRSLFTQHDPGASNQRGGHGFSAGPSRLDPAQQSRNEPLKAFSGNSNAGYHQRRPREDSNGWEKVQNADHSIHGPVYRRSPTKDSRPRAFSRASSRGDSNCLNQHHADVDRWSYSPCNCPKCESRNRSVYVNLTPNPKLSPEEFNDKVSIVMSRWGKVDKLSRLANDINSNFTALFVRFEDDSRISEVASTKDFECPELGCIVRFGAMHHSKYGYEMRQNHGQNSMRTYDVGSQHSTWRGPIDGYRQTDRGGHSLDQPGLVRHDTRKQVSLEQYMINRPQPTKPPVRTSQAPAPHGSIPQPPVIVSNELAKEQDKPPRDTTMASTSTDIQAMPSPKRTLQPSAEAESQSKPPSEEVIPDAAQTNETFSPRNAKGPATKSNEKTIVVNLPNTPTKKVGSKRETSDRNTTPSRAISTPKDSERSTASVNNVSANLTDVDLVPGAEKAADVSNAPSSRGKDNYGARSPAIGSSGGDVGKYRKVFSQAETGSCERFEVPVSLAAAKNKQSNRYRTNTTDPEPQHLQRLPKHDSAPGEIEEPTNEVALDVISAGHAIDELIDKGLSSQAQNQAPVTSVIEIPTKKKNSKSKNKKKKKKKSASTGQCEPSSSQDLSYGTSMNAPNESASQDSALVNIEPAKGTAALALLQLGAFGHTNDTSVPATLTEFVARDGRVTGEPESNSSPEKSEIPYSASKSFRANAGGSLRMPKNRKKKLTHLEIAVREPSITEYTTAASDLDTPRTSAFMLLSATSQMSFATAQEDRSSNGSPTLLSTPATPPLDKKPTPKSQAKQSDAIVEMTPQPTAVLNPTAKDFISPPKPQTSPGSRSSPSTQIKLAPIPLKPQKPRCSTSPASSRTMSPVSSPLGIVEQRADKVIAENVHEKTPFASQTTPIEHVAEELDSPVLKNTTGKNVENTPLPSTTEVPVSTITDKVITQNATPKQKQTAPRSDEEDWQVQHHKRDSSRNNLTQPEGNGKQKNHQHQQDRQGPKKNYFVPKELRTQGQRQPQQQRLVLSLGKSSSVGSEVAAVSLSAAPAPSSGLPATSVWGKSRSTSISSSPSGPSADNTAGKSETSDNSCPSEDNSKQQRHG
ncbi:hypothetical protein CCHL11_08543 [Colletotrichum chlorophyti]|uniref:RRM domain-containing protein n=1 Tax=Colletotrichum chlorophyti TaxID=708187 RepID=A0A1Q8RQF6_9PEZI|nr:hypothetical protein CCHL11_08543 [Colletotrichum chlorophyti]